MLHSVDSFIWCALEIGVKSNFFVFTLYFLLVCPYWVQKQVQSGSVIDTHNLGCVFQVLVYANYARHDQYDVERGYSEIQCFENKVVLPGL